MRNIRSAQCLNAHGTIHTCAQVGPRCPYVDELQVEIRPSNNPENGTCYYVDESDLCIDNDTFLYRVSLHTKYIICCSDFINLAVEQLLEERS